MAKFTSTKLFDGYSTCFRQWRAINTHCRFLHGYAISFRVWFEGELDHRNWVWMMDAQGIIQLRVIDATGCEKFAEFLYKQINDFLLKETNGRVKAAKVEVYEHERNSASYE